MGNKVEIAINYRMSLGLTSEEFKIGYCKFRYSADLLLFLVMGWSKILALAIIFGVFLIVDSHISSIYRLLKRILWVTLDVSLQCYLYKIILMT